MLPSQNNMLLLKMYGKTVTVHHAVYLNCVQ